MILRISKKTKNVVILSSLLKLLFVLNISSASAQTLPGSADPGRIDPLKKPLISDRIPSKIVIPEIKSKFKAPEASKRVKFVLQKLNLEGSTAFKEEEIHKVYQDYIGREISLSMLWKIAEDITKLYQQNGYFLSRAYVPAQEIDKESNLATINVVEGYIDDVSIEDSSFSKNYLVEKLIKKIKSQKPLNAYNLESFMLKMNDLPGKEFRAFVEPIKGANSGVTRLSLRSMEEKGQGSVSFNNFGSRFLGPYQAMVTYKDSFLPLQETTISALASTPADELKYLAFRHWAPIYPDWKVEFSGNYIKSKPGSSLEASDINSDSSNLDIGVSWQPIQQRQENLITSLHFSSKNTNSDILDDNPLTRDRIRALRGTISYDTNDKFNGYNYLSLNINKGMDVLGASQAGDSNLSRAEAKPDFTTANFSYTRQQALYSKFMAIAHVSGQIASGPLFSSEEFGYGGQSIGRAYDPSEITGDQGIATSIELRYLGLDPWSDIKVSPYGFYDIGKVWNEESDNSNEHASSAGFGFLLNYDSKISSNIGVAWPINRDISSPIYGNGKNPRILLQLNYGF